MVVLSSEARRQNRDSALNTIFLTIVAPFEASLTTAAGKVENLWFGYFNLVRVRTENQELAKLAARQKSHLNVLMEERQANIRLKRLLALADKHRNLTLSAVKVVAWDPGPWFSSLIVGAGLVDGVNQEQAVIHDLGAVGRVARVSPYYAKVLLITDHGSAVDAVVQRSRVRGLLSGRGPEPCALKYVRREADIRVGDLVVSSGLDGIFPPGVPLGAVSRVDHKSSDIFLEVDVTPAVDFTSLEEVLVVTMPPRPPEKWPEAELFGPWPQGSGSKPLFSGGHSGEPPPGQEEGL